MPSASRVIQVTNVAPAATRDQMKTLFSFLGHVDDLVIYPEVETMTMPTKICFVKFSDSEDAGVSLHLTNTVFIDRALIVVPVPDGRIPDEKTALSSPTGQYPALPSSTELSKVDEIRRTVYISNLDSSVQPESMMEFFGNEAGEVKFARMAGDDGFPVRAAFVEFSEQVSVVRALALTGRVLGNRAITVVPANTAISKPATGLADASSQDIEEAVRKVNEAQPLISAAADADANGRRSSRSKSRRRSRSRSRHSKRSPSRHRSGSRSRRSRRRSSSRSPRRRTPSPKRRRSPSKSRDRRRHKSRSASPRSSRSSRRSRSPSRRDKRGADRKSKSRSPSKSNREGSTYQERDGRRYGKEDSSRSRREGSRRSPKRSPPPKKSHSRSRSPSKRDKDKSRRSESSRDHGSDRARERDSKRDRDSDDRRESRHKRDTGDDEHKSSSRHRHDRDEEESRSRKKSRDEETYDEDKRNHAEQSEEDDGRANDEHAEHEENRLEAEDQHDETRGGDSSPPDANLSRMDMDVDSE